MFREKEKRKKILDRNKRGKLLTTKNPGEKNIYFLKHPCVSSLKSKEAISIHFSSQNWLIIQATFKTYIKAAAVSNRIVQFFQGKNALSLN